MEIEVQSWKKGNGIEYIIYCPICGQAIKYFSKLGVVKHWGFKAVNETYSSFLERDKHISTSLIEGVMKAEKMIKAKKEKEARG